MVPLSGDLEQNRAKRYFHGVHKNAPIHALQTDMEWVNVKYSLYLCAVLIWKSLLKINNEHLTKKWQSIN